MALLSSPISRQELGAAYCTHYEGMSKAVVDVNRNLLAVDAEMHADLESFLLEQGSLQNDLWGLNLYPEKSGDDFIEYTSLINIRPAQGNPSLTLQDPTLRERVAVVVKNWVTDAF